MASRAELERLDDAFLVATATGIVRELSGSAIADRYRNSPPPRERVIQFILMNQPE